jgi:hypothetical protein
MRDESEKVGFHFTDALSYVIKSIHIFDKLGLNRPLILNLPMCLLPGYEDAIIQSFNGTAVLNLDGSKTNIDDNKAGGKKRVPLCSECKHNTICSGVDAEYLVHNGEDEFQKQIDFSHLSIDTDDVPIKNYFTEDEQCFLELLKQKSPLSIIDIIEMKDKIQICKDCDSMNKIITTADILERK